ncbi:MAG: tetratricopeptide repeat protein, partial [Candidatus Eisenbacteria bacterium]|nr:tetratricopeptide repeat protein [Candidatus Eisenbacteria bacterium]
MKTSLSSVWPPAVMDQEFTSQIEADAASHPEWADLQNRLGLLRWAEGDLEGAIVAFEACLNLNPRYSWASLNMAGCLATKGEFSKARAAIIDAADPVEGAKAVTEGWIALLDGRPDTAEAAIRRIPPRRLELANVLWLRAATAENRDPAEGASMWRSVLEEPTIKAWYGEIDEIRTPREPGERRGGLFPGFGKLWLDLSQSYAQLGRFEEAQKMARRSYLFWSERGDFLHHQGVLCQLQGNETQALQCWTEALDAAPEDSRSATALSFYYSRVGNLDAAMQHVEIAIDRSPGYADLHRQRGLLAAALG